MSKDIDSDDDDGELFDPKAGRKGPTINVKKQNGKNISKKLN